MPETANFSNLPRELADLVWTASIGSDIPTILDRRALPNVSELSGALFSNRVSSDLPALRLMLNHRASLDQCLDTAGQAANSAFRLIFSPFSAFIAALQTIPS